MGIKITVSGVEHVIERIQNTPKGLGTALAEMVKFLTGVFKKPEPYKYISRKAAYGVSFFTDKQRKWFFANGGADMIGDHRTGRANEYSYAANGKLSYEISNPNKSAYWTRSDSAQPNQISMVGWLKVKDKIAANWDAALAIFISTWARIAGNG
jgi:hypothetical protein